MGQRERPGTGEPAWQAKWRGPAGGAVWDGEGRFTGAGRGRWVCVVFMSFVSTQRSSAFHHKAHGGAQIISVTAVTAPRVRSFTTLYTLLKKKVVPSNNSCGFFLPQAAVAGQGWCEAVPCGRAGQQGSRGASGLCLSWRSYSAGTDCQMETVWCSLL